MYRVELLVRGRIDADWSDWMGGLQITHPAPAVSQLSGSLPDQPALYAVLSRLAALNLELLLVRCTPLGYILGCTLLLLCSLIGPMVILQTIMQLRVGVAFSAEQFVVMIGGFLVMSLLAAGVTAAVFRQISDTGWPADQ